MMRKIIICLYFAIELISLKVLVNCLSLNEKLHFSSLDVSLKLNEAVTNDVGYPTLLVRFFHNKLIFSINAILASYLQFWDIRFQAEIFLLSGYFGILCGLYYLAKSKNRYKWLFFILLLLLPFIEIFHALESNQLRFVLIMIPYFSTSIYGIWQFMKNYEKRAYWILSILILISLWYVIVFSKDIFISCIK